MKADHASRSARLLIDGEWRDGQDGATLAVEDPATGEPIAEVADAGAEDAMTALDAACAAQDRWARTPPNERSEILYGAFRLIQAQSEGLALTITREMGKAISESRAEVAYAAEFFRWFAGEALRIDGSYAISGDGASRVLVMRQPVGPSYLITPWNFPLAMGARKVTPAIAAGCTMVVKPAQQTPLSMIALAQILEECGLPPGVLNVVTGSSASEISAPILSDDRLRKVSFTGSTAVGRKLIAQSADKVLKISMELGGNAPFLIFEDADLDLAIKGAMIAKMRNIGEACTSANRFHVADSVSDQFSELLAARMGAMKVGPGTEDGVEVGPLIDAAQRSTVENLVEDALERGARRVVGGRRIDGAGYFFEPTVLAEVPPDARALHEEIFGPVAPVSAFTSEEEAVAIANDTEFGLVSYVYTNDLKRALRVCEALESGMVGLNQGMVSNAGAPFGGFKQSGIGREGGREGIDEFLETKYVAVNL